MSRAMAITFPVLLFLSSCYEVAGNLKAKGFLARADEVDAILNIVKQFLGNEQYEFAKKKIGKIEESLRPKYSSLRKNEHGQLGHGAASYALYRLLGQRHGWRVTGLVDAPDESFEAWSASSPTDLLRKGVPESTLGAIEQKLFSDGYSLHELAVVAATIERFIQTEATQKLQMVFKLQGIPTGKLLQNDEVDHALDAYMALYLIQGMVFKHAPTTRGLEHVLNAMPKIYPHWAQTQQFVRDVQKSTILKTSEFAFPEVELVAQEIGERFGRWQDQQCHSMKARLFSKEDTGPGGAGRIRLAEFYNLTIQENDPLFSESIATLQKLGALDESDSTNPRVIITNYVYGPNSCVASNSKYYEVCCINQCDDIMSHIEQAVASPEATSEQIAKIVASLPSPSYPNGKVLSTWLHRQLQTVAEYHAGRIPLHGRLFAQWMHAAFPRECPFPHAASASHDLRLASFIQSKQSVTEALATKEDMDKIIHSASPRSEKILDAEAHEALSIASMQEELVAI